MKEQGTILIIDDEVQIRRLLTINLELEGFSFLEATTGKEGLSVAATRNPSLILLDLGLPDMDGLVVLQSLREWFTRPVIILSVRSDEENIIQALDHGANDYITKPFRIGELLARIRSAIRQSKTDPDKTLFTFDNVTIDLVSHTVKKNNQLVKVTSTEFSLLSLFARNAGRVLTHQFILKEVWGHGYLDQTQYLRVFVAQLRKKIENDPERPTLLITESGIGYRLGE